jgi:hypothetical protein
MIVTIMMMMMMIIIIIIIIKILINVEDKSYPCAYAPRFGNL